MKEFRTLGSLQDYLGVSAYEIEKAWNTWVGMEYMYIGDTEVKKHYDDLGMTYVVIDKTSDSDVREYLMKYVIEDYHFCVYVDDIEKWQECKVLRIQNIGEEIKRATVVTKKGTQLNRIVKEIDVEGVGEEPIEDGCVYMFYLVNDFEERYS